MSSTQAPAKKAVAFSKSTSGGSSPNPPWLHRIREVQLSQITPVQRAELEEKCRARQVLAKKAKACKGVSMRSKNAVYHTMNVQQQMMQPLPSQQPQQQQQGGWSGGGFGFGGGAPPQAMSRQAQASGAMAQLESRDAHWSESTSYQAPPPQRQRRRSAEVEGEADESDDDLSMADAGRDNAEEDAEMAQEEEALVVTTDDINTVLMGLRQEPKDDELTAAKFQVFEKFSDKVSVIRSALEEVAGSALRDLPEGAPRQGVRNDLAKLETAEMSGIYDQSRYWFVHDMMKQAAANCTSMDGMSNRIEALLKFAASNTQTDCPICLRAYSGPSVPGQSDGLVHEDGEAEEVVIPKTLSCCHSVCGDCWTQWCALQGATAFCPLCRNKEFLEFLARSDQGEGESARQPMLSDSDGDE